jgi:hypothetical protein
MFVFDVALEGNVKLADELRQLARAVAADSEETRQAELEIAEEVEAIAPSYTPVISGSLASSHAVFVTGEETFVAINPGATNPWSDENPPQYGPEVHDMGGFSYSGHERAFYDVIVREEGDRLLEGLEESFIGTLAVFR